MYDEHTLPNGLKIIGERIDHFRSVSVGVWVGVGAQYEQRTEMGISHFIEHMLFKGTDRRTSRQISETMDAVGGQLNAFTAKECTCFYAKVVDEHFELAMDVLSDLVLHSTFDAGELEKEKGVILEEINMSEDAPEDLVHELLMEARYGDQHIAWPILGTEQTVRGFSRDDLMGYWHRMYRPDRTVLAVAGHYDWDRLIQLAEKMFDDWNAEGAPGSFPATVPCQPTILRKEKQIEQLHICLAYDGVKIDSESIYPLSIFNSVFGGAMSSRLFQKIRDEAGMAYTVYSYPSSYLDTGVFAVYAGTSIEHGPEVIRLIREERTLMLRDGLTQQEFEQAREQLKGGFILGLESTSSRMNALGRRKLLLGTSQTETDVINKINAITYDQVMDVTRQVLNSAPAWALVGKGAEKLEV